MDRMTTKHRVCLALDEGHQYPRTIAERTNLGKRQVQIAIAKLQRRGAVVRHGLGYRLTDEASAALHVEPTRGVA